MEKYDIIIAGAGASGVFMAYELTKLACPARTLLVDKGAPLGKEALPDQAGSDADLRQMQALPHHERLWRSRTLSDGKYNITTQFGGELHKYVGHDKAMELMEYVDGVLCSMGGSDARLYHTSNELKTRALQFDLHLLEARVRHLGTDRNVKILGRIYDYISAHINTRFYTELEKVEKLPGGGFKVTTDKGEELACRYLVLAAGRSGSRWISSVCDSLGIRQQKNRVDIGVRVELPAEIFRAHHRQRLREQVCLPDRQVTMIWCVHFA